MGMARQFIKDRNKAKSTEVERVVERAEDSMFKAYFEGYYEAIEIDYRQFGEGMERQKQEVDMAKLMDKQI